MAGGGTGAALGVLALTEVLTMSLRDGSHSQGPRFTLVLWVLYRVFVRLLSGYCMIVVWLLFGFERFFVGLVLGNATQLRVNHPECARVLALH